MSDLHRVLARDHIVAALNDHLTCTEWDAPIPDAFGDAVDRACDPDVVEVVLLETAVITIHAVVALAEERGEDPRVTLRSILGTSDTQPGT